MQAAGILTLMLHLLVGNKNPDTLEFKQVKLLCREVSYTYVSEKYTKVGIVAGGKDYLTNYEDIDKLTEEIDRQCTRRK